VGGDVPSWWADVNTVMTMTANLKGRRFLRPLSDCQPLTFSILFHEMHEVSSDVANVTPTVICGAGSLGVQLCLDIYEARDPSI
jgi:NADH dehydrogenase FAD-containing subunit